ncbi:MAG TPA: cell wall-active antibiotics response protein LiaF [candidate division Zixibacteria bacterium]|nr:cell wall-active antibiotics response protein [candidate division Zixibacteria bacterium]MDD4917079.1 cell wall-active antibiotics response protein LiaF [candidate division Zixibacteria bacterium]MDM7972939.1 cell wall-active antibiotics response protein LiaF [candidate division Zixibacteria bacterium]HOD65305.1 cell wall-active antibiotics response protein LiaF [candidate division Zixibacteria bacterium]HQL23589.1 cell wall-active antibiotics response protein LiaF [candidate division Zixiba
MTGRRATFGIILILLGFLFLLNSLDVMSVGEVLRYLVPLGFIALGIWLIIRRKQQDAALSFEAASAPPPPPPPSPSPAGPAPQTFWAHEGAQSTAAPAGDAPAGGSADPAAPAGGPQFQSPEYGVMRDGKLRYSKLIGDLTVDLRDRAVQHVEVSMGIGDLEIRVHGARLEGGLCRMIVSGFVGDIRILLPPDMAVLAHCSNFIGDIDLLGRRVSGFSSNLDAQTANYAAAERRLYIAANSFLGDIKVYQV